MFGKATIGAGGLKILGGLYLGWGIGANNAANIFGTAVGTNVIRYRAAVLLVAVFVVIGSMTEGPRLFLAGTTSFSNESSADYALIATLAAALTITVVTYLSLPTSTSQAAIGAFMGIAIAGSGLGAVDWTKFFKMVICWLFHPLIGLALCLLLLKLLRYPVNRYLRDAGTRNRVFKVCFIVFGCYGAYVLGANNVVVTTVAYYNVGMFGAVGSSSAALIGATLGGVSIALGALTYGGRVMMTIGKKITPLDPFSSLVVVLVHSLTLHLFTRLNIPVSSSHAVVGAVIGVGLANGMKTINYRTLMKIFVGWLVTPLVAGVAAYGLAVVVPGVG